MQEVSGPIIAIALTLVAVFVPLAFMTGLDGPVLQAVRDDHRDLDGDLGVQLADLVAGFVRDAVAQPWRKEDFLTRVMNRVLGRFFKGFNKVFHRGSTEYGRGVKGVLRRKGAMLAVYAILLGARC
jgi:Cation/multidrug efflux pump